MTKVQVKKNTFYFHLGSKPNFHIFGITVSMWNNMSLKQSSLQMMPWIFNMELASVLGIEK